MFERWMIWVRDPVRWFICMLLVGVMGGVWIGVSAVSPSEISGGGIPSPREGFTAPDFTLQTLQGGEITLSDYRGKAVVLNLWASWCPPCRAEMPALQAAHDTERQRGLEVIALNTTYQDQEADLIDFIQTYNLTLSIVLDQTGEVARQYNLHALPSTFFIGPDGVIEKVVIGGPMSEATIRSAIQEILGDE
jgi:peroxiredoxin